MFMSKLSTAISAVGSSVIVALFLGGCQPVEKKPAEQGAVRLNSSSQSTKSNLNIWRPGSVKKKSALKFEPLGRFVDGNSFTLSNGKVVELADWPTVSISSNEDGNCTSTLVGPRTILTAAHCVDAGKNPGEKDPELTGSITIAGDKFDLVSCTMHFEYKAQPQNSDGGVRDTRDFALCKLDRSVDLSRISPESLDMSTMTDVGHQILLAGYGCVNIRITAAEDLIYDPADGELRMGDDEVYRIKNSVSTEDNGIWVSSKAIWDPSNKSEKAKQEKNEKDEPTLCPGDSGGPVMTGASIDNQRASRRVVAVNSAVGWERNGAKYNLYSFVSPLGTADFRKFLEKYLAEPENKGTIICGYNRRPGFGGCRA